MWQKGDMHGRGGTCMVGGMHGGGHAWWGACMAGQGECVAGGMHGREACVVGEGACVVGGG